MLSAFAALFILKPAIEITLSTPAAIGDYDIANSSCQICLRNRSDKALRVFTGEFFLRVYVRTPGGEILKKFFWTDIDKAAAASLDDTALIPPHGRIQVERSLEFVAGQPPGKYRLTCGDPRICRDSFAAPECQDHAWCEDDSTLLAPPPHEFYILPQQWVNVNTTS